LLIVHSNVFIHVLFFFFPFFLLVFPVAGVDACLADRAKVKEKLVELLPKFKRKINRLVLLHFNI
jgi:hypothetical protein